mgnify:CR=1 FL=1
MKLTVQRIFDVTQVLALIINEKRPLPGKGVYRVARMHAKLFSEFTTINDQRTAKVMSYGHKNEDGLDAVPDDKMEEFVAWWADIASVEVEAPIEPIPIDQLAIDGQESSISFAEFVVLDNLVEG